MIGLKKMMAISLLVVVTPSAYAQSSFQEFLKIDEAAQKKDSAADQELVKFEEVLNGSNTQRALRAMKFMLTSKKPQLVRYAKEFGLLSAEKLFRDEALRSVFDEGGPFRIELDLSTIDEEKSRIKEYINYLKGGYSADGTKGYYVFRTVPYDTKLGCWKFLSSNNCAFYLANASVSLKGWNYGAGSLTLGNDGVMRGTLRYTTRTGAPVPAQIVIID